MGKLILGNDEYVVIPKAEYERLVGTAEDGTVLAEPFMRASLGRKLKAAREHAGLSQVELADKLRRSQSAVSQSEAGTIKVSDDYIAAVLKACNLPKGWKAPK